jgi:peroxiredoxin (alkyl hydroperoxide reductase subunit C)
MTVGRNLDEIKRTLIALQTSKKEAVSTPANWNPGDDVMVPYKKSEKQNKEDGLYDIAWYMTFKKSK